MHYIYLSLVTALLWGIMTITEAKLGKITFNVDKSQKLNLSKERIRKKILYKVQDSGGLNIGTKTRVSIEIRLFDQKKFDLKKNFDPKLFN